MEATWKKTLAWARHSFPNLDSIQDFRVLTSNFDAEYGNYSGGQVVVTTKIGNE